MGTSFEKWKDLPENLLFAQQREVAGNIVILLWKERYHNINYRSVFEACLRILGFELPEDAFVKAEMVVDYFDTAIYAFIIGRVVPTIKPICIWLFRDDSFLLKIIFPAELQNFKKEKQEYGKIEGQTELFNLTAS